MPDLSHLLSQEALRQTPTGRPPFEYLLSRRRSRNRRIRTAQVLVAVAATATVALVVPTFLNTPTDTLAARTPPEGPAVETTAPPAPVEHGYRAEDVVAYWTLEDARPGQDTIDIRVAGNGCAKFLKASAVASPKGMDISVTNRQLVPIERGYGCADTFTRQAVTIKLPRALLTGEAVLGQCDPVRSVICGQLRS